MSDGSAQEAKMGILYTFHHYHIPMALLHCIDLILHTSYTEQNVLNIK